MTDQSVITVRDKIDAKEDKTLKPDETMLTIIFADGSKLEKHVQHAVGSLVAPMTDEQLTTKFVDQAGLVLGEASARSASDSAWRIRESRNVAEILRTL